VPARDANTYYSPQPNVPGRGIVAGFSTRFWVLTIVIGLAAGFAAGAFVELLHLVERLSWGESPALFLTGVRESSDLRHVGVLLLAGVLSGVGMLVIRRVSGSSSGEVSEATWLRDARLPLIPSLARGTLSIVTVGMGVSLGREGAPQLAGAAVASELCRRSPTITAAQRRLLVACGAGAGMAAVYNVPLGGALFALEVLLGTLELPLVLPALLTSLVATAAAWTITGNHATYFVPSFAFSARQLVWALIVGPLAGGVAILWVRLVAAANRRRPHGRGRLVAPVLVFGGLGVLAIPYPQLLGNGLEVTQLALLGALSLGLFAVLTVLKPLVTGACLATGSPGGLFTPTLALGVLFGGLLGHLWSLAWPGSPVGSYAWIGGGALLAAAMQGPLSATVLLLELTRTTGTLTVPMLLAVAEATILARRLGAPSIYSARIAPPEAEERPEAPPLRSAELSR